MKFDQYDIWYYSKIGKWVLELFVDGLPIQQKYFSSEELARKGLGILLEEKE